MVGRVEVGAVLALHTEELSLVEVGSGAVAANAGSSIEIGSVGRAVDSVGVGELGGVDDGLVVDGVGAIVVVAVVVSGVVVAAIAVAALVASGIEDRVGVNTVDASLAIEEWSLGRAWDCARV